MWFGHQHTGGSPGTYNSQFDYRDDGYGTGSWTIDTMHHGIFAQEELGTALLLNHSKWVSTANSPKLKITSICITIEIFPCEIYSAFEVAAQLAFVEQVKTKRMFKPRQRRLVR